MYSYLASRLVTAMGCLLVFVFYSTLQTNQGNCKFKTKKRTLSAEIQEAKKKAAVLTTLMKVVYLQNESACVL